MAEHSLIRTLLLWFSLVVLLQEGHAKLAIVEPYPENIYPIEGTDAQVTCIAYDPDNKAMPARIEFMRRDNIGQHSNITDPRVTFKSQFELGGKRLSKTMYIENVQENDDAQVGKYECWVFEVGKSVHTEAHGFSVAVILTKYLPQVKVTSDIVANPKDEVVLTCNVTAQDDGSKSDAVLKAISWTKDGKLLEKIRHPNPDDPAETLDPITIDSVEPKDGGTYICTLLVVVKMFKEVNITGNVTVSVKPRFVGDISNKEVKRKSGESVQFSCAAVGYPILLEWKRQRKSEAKAQCISSLDDHYNITRKDVNSTYVLMINDVAHDDAGKYFCCFPSNCSDITKGCQEWTLLVNARLAIVEPYPTNIYSIEGTDAQVTCIAYDKEEKINRIEFKRRDDYDQYYNITDPRVTYKSQFELGGKRLITTMYIKDVQGKDDDEVGGKYECWLFEEGKSVHTAAHGFSVTVILKKYVPQVKVTPDIVANHKDEVVLTCNVTAQDDGSKSYAVLKAISWTKDGKLLEKVRNPNQDDPAETLSHFTIDSVESKDGGTYICTLLVVMKRITEVNITGNVTVSVKPRFVVDISNKEVKRKSGESVHFYCAAVGYPLLLEWKRQRKSEAKAQCISGSDDHYNITRKDVNSNYVLTINDIAHDDKGKYFCCFPSNCSDNTKGCQEWTLLVDDGTGTKWEVIGTLIVLGIVCPFVIFAVWFLRRRNKNASTIESPPEVAPAVPMRHRRPSDPWEVLDKEVFIQGFLGVGAFGEVWRAVVQHVGGIKGNRECAVKKLRVCVSSDNREKFMKEIEIMKMLGKHRHPNIIRFRGCVTRSEPLMIIMEYAAFGDLLGFMRKSRGVADKHYNAEDLHVRELTNYDLVKFSQQIACGMQFLKSKGIMHRDLAARNVVVTTKFICKITDFGMAFQTERYGYGTAKRGRIPIKWTAPEVLFETSTYQVSSKSDVWSYGIVLYEIFTLGGTPYDGFREADVIAQLQNKQYRMPQPSHVSESIYSIMMQCWSEDPDDRPTFEELCNVFLDYMAGEHYMEVIDIAQYESNLYQPEKFLSDQEECDDPPVPDNPPVTNIPTSRSLSETSLDDDVISPPPTTPKGSVSERDISTDPVLSKPRYITGKALPVDDNESLQDVRF